jgi:hypothetical protein
VKNRWSRWRYFKELTSGNVPESAGVYQIRCVNQRGTPQKLIRLASIDKDGILGIGESNNLYRRLRQFWVTISKKDYTRHAAAWHYLSFCYDQRFPENCLQFRYKKVKNKDMATCLEFDLLLKYRKKFMDGPPLNNSRGKFPDDWEKRIKKAFGRFPPKDYS